MATTNQIVVKDPDTCRNDMLRTLKNGLIAAGKPTANVTPGSDFYHTADALAGELAVVGANGIIKTDAQMPDTATDDTDPNGDQDLSRWGAMLKVEPQPASGSVGSVIIECSAPSPVPFQAELTDDTGQIFRVTVGGTYANGEIVPVEAVSTGESTNHDEGDVLSWKQAPTYCSEKVSVAVGGLINGAPAEDSETQRQRIYGKLQVAPSSGNWEQIVETAEESTNSVQKAYCYPAVQGPASCDVAVTAAPTATNKGRTVASALMNGTVIPYTEGQTAKFGQLNVTSVTGVATDVAIGLTLPDAPTANPPGLGGGWKDGSPWPAPDGVSAFKCAVTAVTSTTEFTVEGNNVGTPIANVTRIAWLSPTEWKLYQATVTGVTNLVGSFVITIDRPFVGIGSGALIWPDIVNASTYVAALLAAYAKMGPGEKTTNTSALVRGFRHPPPSVAWPYALGPHLLSAMTKVSSDVASAQFFYRNDGGTPLNGPSGTMAPPPPPALSNAPRIYVPRHLAFYRIRS